MNVTLKKTWTKVQARDCDPVYFCPETLEVRRTLAECDEGEVSVPWFRPTSRMPGEGGRPAQIGLEMCSGCNLACEYCYQRIEDTNFSHHLMMSFPQAVRSLNRLAPPKRVKRVSVSMLGGEPTLNMDTWLKVYAYCRKTYEGFKPSFTTNGTRFDIPLGSCVEDLSPKLAEMTIGEWVARSGHIGVLVSCDGPEEAHDRFRPFKGGRGSHARVMEGMRHLKQVAPEFCRRIGFASRFYTDLSEVSMLERCLFFNELFKEGLGCRYGFGPAVSPDWEDSHGVINTYADQLAELGEWYMEEVLNGRYPVLDGPFKSAIYKFVHRKPSAWGCNAGTNYMNAGATGTIYACHRTYNSRIGHLEKGIDRRGQEQWMNNNMMFTAPCMTCDYRYICGTICRAGNLIETGCTAKVSRFSCEVRKAQIAAGLKVYLKLGEEKLKEAARNTLRVRTPGRGYFLPGRNRAK